MRIGNEITKWKFKSNGVEFYGSFKSEELTSFIRIEMCFLTSTHFHFVEEGTNFSEPEHSFFCKLKWEIISKELAFLMKMKLSDSYIEDEEAENLFDVLSFILCCSFTDDEISYGIFNLLRKAGHIDV